MSYILIGAWVLICIVVLIPLRGKTKRNKNNKDKTGYID